MGRRLYTFWIDGELSDGLKRVKERDGITESEQIRRAIQVYIALTDFVALSRPRALELAAVKQQVEADERLRQQTREGRRLWRNNRAQLKAIRQFLRDNTKATLPSDLRARSRLPNAASARGVTSRI